MANQANRKKATKEQFKTYVEFLEKNDTLRYGKGTPEVKKQAFLKLINLLNSVGSAIKDETAWKKTITEWRCNTRKRAREGKSLTEIEKNFLNIIGISTVTGIQGVEELGVVHDTPDLLVTDEEREWLEEVLEPKQNEPENDVEESKAENDVEESRAENDDEQTKPKDNVENLEEEQPCTSKKTTYKKTSENRIKNKTTMDIYEIYLNFLSNCHDLKLDTIVDNLNEKFNGPSRSSAEWKQVFSEWQNRVIAKARRIQLHQMGTGGGMPIYSYLNAMEEKLLSLLSEVIINGNPNVPELGLDVKKYTQKNTRQSKKSLNCRTRSTRSKRRIRIVKETRAVLRSNQIFSAYLKELDVNIKQIIKEILNICESLNRLIDI